MANQITLSPDEYNVFQDKERMGILYNVDFLRQPSRSSCWATSTAALLSFAHVIDKPPIIDVMGSVRDHGTIYQEIILHGYYVSDLIKAMFDFLKTKDSDKANTYKELFCLNKNVAAYTPPQQSAFSSPAEWFLNNYTGLYDSIQQSILLGRYGRFQQYWHDNNSTFSNLIENSDVCAMELVSDCIDAENKRRESYKPSPDDIKKYFPFHDGSYNPYNDYKAFLNEDDGIVVGLIQNHFYNCNSSVLPPKEFKGFFEDLCGLKMESTNPTEMNKMTDNELILKFTDYLFTYGPLLINYDPDLTTDNAKDKEFHMVVLCGISINTRDIKNSTFTIMDPILNDRLEHHFLETPATEFINQIRSLSETCLTHPDGKFISQVIHLPDKIHFT